MLKKVFSTASVLLLIFTLGVYYLICSADSFNISSLKLDQGNSYISLSKNDINGYNRWVPFYFKINTETDLETEEVENLLSKKISEATLYTNNDKLLYKTDKLIWSAYKVKKKTYNLTLVLIPELNKFTNKKLEYIKKLVLTSNKNKNEYNLSKYIVETRETIDEKQMYISLSSIESEVSDAKMAEVDYGIMKNGNKIKNLVLDFPKNFSDIIGYKIANINHTKEDTVEYKITVQLKAKNSKTIFRPFLKVKYGKNKYGWLIPSVPVYFK